MTTPLFLNGRFFSQAITGVQRFAIETTAAIDRLMDAGEWPDTTILAPRPESPGRAGDGVPPYRKLRLHAVGRTRGQTWEQMELPIAARGGTLINLGNTGPVLFGARQVVVIHDAGVFDTPESYSLQFRLWYRAVQHRLTSVGVKVVTVSKFACRRISECLDLDPSGIDVMYEGADHILRVPADAGTLQRHGLSPGKFALIVGAGAAHKNIAAMKEAADLLTRHGIVLAIAGASDSSMVFRADCGQKLPGRRLGRVTDNELRALYKSALCLLFPSRYEGFGLPPVEAMACGCPVIASRGGAVEEVCSSAVLYFTTQEPESLVRAIEQILWEPDLASNLRERGIARAAAFSWDASARVLSSVVRQMQ